jgi:hypothetical protein
MQNLLVLPMNMRTAIALSGLALAMALTGCGPSGPKLYPVSGTVTYNGMPLPEGHIIFMPTSAGEVEDADKIKDGRFAFLARPGSKKVKILATRGEGPVDPQMGMQPQVQYIPPKYSSAELTELTAVVAESAAKDKNVFEFKLTGP